MIIYKTPINHVYYEYSFVSYYEQRVCDLKPSIRLNISPDKYNNLLELGCNLKPYLKMKINNYITLVIPKEIYKEIKQITSFLDILIAFDFESKKGVKTLKSIKNLDIPK